MFIFQLLEDMIAARNDDPDIYKIQPIGKHYTLRWAQEDLLVSISILIGINFYFNWHKNSILIGITFWKTATEWCDFKLVLLYTSTEELLIDDELHIIYDHAFFCVCDFKVKESYS